MAKRIRAPNSSSAVSVQQSVGSNPGRDTCVPEHFIIASLHPGVGKDMVLSSTGCILARELRVFKEQNNAPQRCIFENVYGGGGVANRLVYVLSKCNLDFGRINL